MRGDAERTAQNIATDLVTFAAGIVVAWALYVLLRPVDRNLALLALRLRLAEVAVHSTATVFSLGGRAVPAGHHGSHVLLRGRARSLAPGDARTSGQILDPTFSSIEDRLGRNSRAYDDASAQIFGVGRRITISQ